MKYIRQFAKKKLVLLFPLFLIVGVVVLPTTAFADVMNTLKVVHRGNGAEPETLDIHKSSGVPEANIQRDLFEGLITEATDGSLIAGAAKSWEQDKTGKRWTFHLRENGKWSDGTKVTASDFVNAFQRAVNPATASKYTFILWPIKNAKAISKGEQKDISALGVKAIDPLTLEIELENPTPFLTGLLSHHMAYPIPSAVIKQHGSKWTRAGNLVSNGAYTLAEWQPQSHIKLVKNNYYHDAGKTKIGIVFYHPTEDKSAELKRFRAGELDVTDDIPSDQIKWIDENLKQSFHNSPYIGTYYLALNVDKAPFKDNADLRKALSLALDRKILTDKVTKAGELPGLGWVPPGMNGYTAQTIPELVLEKKQREAKAKKLYEKAGYSRDKPLEVELLYNTSDNHKKIAIALTAMWKQVLGIKVKLRNEEWKVYLSSRSQHQFQMVRSGWIGDFNDASNFLDLFRSDVGTMNPSGWKNAEYDTLMIQAESETDSQKRVELMQQAEKILLADMPLIPIYYYTTQHLVKPMIKGWQDNVMFIQAVF